MAVFLSLLSGASLGLAFAPFHLYWLAVVAPAILFYVWRRSDWQDAPRQGYWFGVGYFLSGVHWVYYSIYTYGGTPLIVAVLMNLLLVLFLALYPWMLGWLGRRYFGRRGVWFQIAAFALFWVMLEWLRSVMLTGFPWLSLGYSQIDSPLAGYAPLVGVYGVSGLVVLSAAMLVVGLTDRTLRLVAWPGVLTIWLCGWLLTGISWTEPHGKGVNVAIIQANIDQGQKWNPELRFDAVRVYSAMTRDNFDSELIIWPETAVPFFLKQALPYLDPLLRDMEKANTALLFGIPVREPDGRYYNALVAMGTAQGEYRKQHLVPFGEYVPLLSLLGDLIQFLKVPMSSFSKGDSDQALISFNGSVIGASVCYEDAFPSLIHAMAARSDFMVNVSNDGWFGRTIAPDQHLQIARMRALESGRWLLRATNTGISAIIDNTGRLIRHSGQDVVAVVKAKVERRNGSTLYSLIGESVWVVLLTLLLLPDIVKKQRRYRGRVASGAK